MPKNLEVWKIGALLAFSNSKSEGFFRLHLAFRLDISMTANIVKYQLQVLTQGKLFT